MKYIKALILSLFIIKVFSSEDEVDILNSYNNTDELIKKFPVMYPTTVKPGLERNIQNRLLTGFENWNRGYEGIEATKLGKLGEIFFTLRTLFIMSRVQDFPYPNIKLLWM